MRLGGFLVAVLAALSLAVPRADAAEKVIAGTLGGQAPLWPFYIAVNEGFLAKHGIDMEINFAQNGSAVLQQLTGGSLDVVISVGLTEAMQAIDKGAPLAIFRIIGKTAPYVLIAKPTIASIADLKGKTTSIGGPTDITNIYFARMMKANGLKEGEYETISAGVAAARFAALQAGVADAALVLPPLNFHADKSGFHTIGLSFDYVKDIPFTAAVVGRAWAAAHPALVRGILAAADESVAWFNNPANRAAAISVLVKVGKANDADAEASYDFLRHIDYFETGDTVSRSGLKDLLAEEAKRNLVSPGLTVDKLVLTGVTEVTE
ncbi:MAG TPA: ABC transporter substrate-binding protein [Stellaceae bacterium]|nr:ABC transporter substrate-binding protein [Stellaceae bacterium]